MSYSIIAGILLATFAFSASIPVINKEKNVLARFYPDFVQLYRPATFNSYVDEEQKIEQYQFRFTEQEFQKLSIESLTMLNTAVIDRTITYHPTPNFEVNGTRYFYRRSSKQNSSVEIELINADEHLFREVKEPNHYFYLSSFRNIEYIEQTPILPYYEITFICNSSETKDNADKSPLLTYIDRRFHYVTRYSLDLSLSNTDKQLELEAYADIRNNGDKTIVVKAAELITGDVSLIPKPSDLLNLIATSRSTSSAIHSLSKLRNSFTSLFSEQASGTYIYRLSLPFPVTLPPLSVKSLQFATPNVTIEPFATYSSVFLPYSTHGKLLKSYNLTSLNKFLPNGRLFLRENGRFIGQTDVPDLCQNETYTMIFGYDADITYRREVEVVSGDEYGDSITYYVKYVFENAKTSRDIPVYFTESFNSFKYFQVKSISTPTDKKESFKLISSGTKLRGSFLLPRDNGEKTVSFNVVVYKYKPRYDYI